MKKFKNYLFATTGFVLLLACFVVGASFHSEGEASNQASTANATNVNVVNKPSVNIDNIPTVKLAEGATVQIGNLASTPLTKRNAIEPINLSSNIININQPIHTVPPGKRLIIEYASVTKNDTVSSITINALAGRQWGRFPLAASQLVKIYADPNTQIVISTTCATPCNLRGITVNLSGYLEDAQ
jgi:hypothetical protein